MTESSAESRPHPRASTQDGTYPRPQLVRNGWRSLDGSWLFAYDDEDLGLAQRWFGPKPARAAKFDRAITVPFPPESPASGIGDTDFHPVVWYRRVMSTSDLPSPVKPDDRVLVHFGAVDYAAMIWCDGDLVGTHVGGQAPFSVDVTRQFATDGEHVLVVRAHDDPEDREIPRGKQDWKRRPHGIWYHRTTGIWQTVWVEVAPALRIADLSWTADIAHGMVRCDVTLLQRPQRPVAVDIALQVDGVELASSSKNTGQQSVTVEITLPNWRSPAVRDRLLWSPDHPILIDADVVLRGARLRRRPMDEVASYLGVRSTGVGGGTFLLNGEPYYLRSILDQGYWSETHLANPGTDWLRDDVEQILALGFNCVRVHQKAEDPRFLYWTDRLGLLVWGETANASLYSQRAIDLLTREWLDLVRRDRSHPSIVTWVPINESWGVKEIESEPAQQQFAAALASLTRALDPTRPVVSNDGWQHVDSDIVGVHDYSSDVVVLLERYGSKAAIARTLDSDGPAGRKLVLTDAQRARYDADEIPLMLTEFGGVSSAARGGSWGYTTVKSDDEYAAVLTRLFDTIRGCPGVAGYCYTQYLDTAQETNGLLTADRQPKLPVDLLRRIITGHRH